MSAEDPLWTVAQVAARLKVSAVTIRRLVHRDELRGAYVGRAIRIRESAVIAYLQTPTPVVLPV